jgi:hypothetical protein
LDNEFDEFDLEEAYRVMDAAEECARWVAECKQRVINRMREVGIKVGDNDFEFFIKKWHVSRD